MVSSRSPSSSSATVDRTLVSASPQLPGFSAYVRACGSWLRRVAGTLTSVTGDGSWPSGGEPYTSCVMAMGSRSCGEDVLSATFLPLSASSSCWYTMAFRRESDSVKETSSSEAMGVGATRHVVRS